MLVSHPGDTPSQYSGSSSLRLLLEAVPLDPSATSRAKESSRAHRGHCHASSVSKEEGGEQTPALLPRLPVAGFQGRAAVFSPGRQQWGLLLAPLPGSWCSNSPCSRGVRSVSPQETIK